jgi:iron complex transport system permease protein
MRLTLLVVFSIACVMVAPFVGMEILSPSDALQARDANLDARIFWDIRLPRVLAGFLCGAALSLGGAAFQALFRNPLAAPFTLGVSSGAGLGAALFVRLGLGFSVLGIPGISLAAFAGAAGAMLLVYGLTRIKGDFSTATLLLGGVAVSFSLSSLTLFIQYSANLYDSFRLIRWMMGGLGAIGFDSVRNMAPFALIGAGVLLWLPHELNILNTGRDLALSRGVNVDRVQKLIFLSVSLMVGGVVAMCGPIGFVGIMAPHICRLLVGNDHRVLTPAAALFGGAFLVLCDTAARTLIAPAELPVGVLTAMLGGPFFLWLLLTREGGRGWG